MRKTILSIILALPAICLADSATKHTSGPALAAIFSDHMVLQRGIPCPVWGTAEPGSQIAVTFGENSVTTKTDTNGRWQTSLPALHCPSNNQSRTLSVKSGSESTVIHDVLTGDVWLFGGQSNMAFSLDRSTGGQQEIANANDPLIRVCHVNGKRTAHDAPLPTDIEPATWSPVLPDSVAKFSAIAYYFGKAIRKSTDVPIGLIDTSVGGTPMRCWMSRETLNNDPLLRSQVEENDHKVLEYPKLKEKYERKLAVQRKDPKKTAKLVPPKDPNSSYRLAYFYNSRIRLLKPFAIRGVVWYQGEADAGRHTIFEHQFATLVAEWRREWGQGDFPWIYAQLAPFSGANGRKFPFVWEAQSQSQDIPNSAMVVTLDHGVADNIHPPEKRPIGERLARAARNIAYHETIVASAPSFKSARTDNDRVILTFDHPELGLTSTQTDLGHFTIAGADKKFLPADARLAPDHRVIVSNPAIGKPVAVRYGWYDLGEPVGASLFSRDDLPVSPFRTDDWEP